MIDDRLPLGRLLALMTGEDGGVVSELRGLSAWLAAHCLEARRELIERDPEGVAAYGDAGVFYQEEKRRLLECCYHLPDYARTSCSRLHSGSETGCGPLTRRCEAHSDRFGGRCTLPLAQSTRSVEQGELGG